MTIAARYLDDQLYKDGRWIFVYDFPKNERSNIDTNEEEALKKLASSLLSYSQDDIEKAKKNKVLIEVNCDAEEEISDS